MIAQIILPLGLALIMFSLGLDSRMAELVVVLRRPLAIVLGLICKMLLLPAIALLLVLAWSPPAEIAVGMLILAACPAGVTSSLLTRMAGGGVLLAATVTALSSMAATVTMPLLVNWGLTAFAAYDHPVAIPIGRMMAGIAAVDAVPLAVGMAIAHLWPRAAGRLAQVLRPVATGVFVMIVLGAFVDQRQVLADHFAAIAVPALTLNVLALATAFAMARLCRRKRAERVAIMMETGLQNGALGIFVAAGLLGMPAMVAPSVVYAVVMNVTALSLVWLERRREA